MEHIEKSELIERIERYVKNIASAADELVVQKDRLGAENSFRLLTTSFQELRNVAKLLSDCNLTCCPKELVQKLWEANGEVENATKNDSIAPLQVPPLPVRR